MDPLQSRVRFVWVDGTRSAAGIPADVRLLADSFADMDYYFFEDGRHDLLNETEVIRTPVLNVVSLIL